jgi:perosamine synthetase
MEEKEMKPIPIALPLTGREEKRAIDQVLDSGILAQGEQVEEFEEKFAKFVGTDFAVACSSGTAALKMAIEALNIKREVLIPSFSFIATATSVLFNGAKPVFVDIDPKTYTIDPRDLERKITRDSQAIMPVHLYGQCANMDEIMEISEKHDLYVIEDAAQAHGAEWDSRRAGTFGEAGCFSFYPTKNMTTGEGGIVTTNNGAMAARMRSFRNHGQQDRYVHSILGYNFRMTNVHAAIGLAQLKKLDKFNAARRKNAEYYDAHLDVDSPFTHPKAKHVYHQYTVSVDKREDYQKHLAARGIGYGVYYPTPIHRQPVFGTGDRLPNTDRASDRVLSIPVHPGVSAADRKRVVDAMNSAQ